MTILLIRINIHNILNITKFESLGIIEHAVYCIQWIEESRCHDYSLYNMQANYANAETH